MLQYIIDLTTSREYRGKPPVGIVRTQREIASAFLRNRVGVTFTFFDTEERQIRVIPIDEADRIIHETPRTDYGHPDTQHMASAHLYPPVVLGDNSVIVSSGLLWDDDSLDVIYRKKRSDRFKLIQVMYDIIPIIMPEFCVDGMFERFPKFVLNTLWTADVIFGISENTNEDLRKYSKEIGAPLPMLDRIELGCNLNSSIKSVKPVNLEGIEPGRFVIYVSTIEPRKNHALIYHIWRRIARERPDILIPIIFVGRVGWNSNDILSAINKDEILTPDQLTVLQDVDDTGLEWLYANCSFSVYPSLYEGWGLPVAEAMAHGKLCIASDNSSIPEVAQECAVLIDPLDFKTWYDTIVKLLWDRSLLDGFNGRVRDKFVPTRWNESADSFCDRVVSLGRL